MCDCFHIAFPNWHAASSGTGAGRRLRGPEAGAEDDSICDEPSQFTEGERPRPQGSSPVEEYPETEKYTDSDKECEAEHDTHHETGSGKKTKKSGLGSMFEKRSTPKMSKLKEVPSPESGVIVKTAKDGCAEGLVYGGGGRDGIFIKEVVPESPASKSLKLKEGDQILSATVYFDNMSYEDAIQILEHAQAYKVKLCLKRKPDITEIEPAIESDIIPEEDLDAPEMRAQGKTKRRGDARISWPKFPSFGKGRKSRFTRSHSSSEADEQKKLELSPTTSDTESPIKSQDALKGKKKHKMKLSALKKKGRTSSSEDQETPTTGQISPKTVKTHDSSDMLSPECLESPSGETPEVYVTEGMKVVEDLRLEQNDQKLTEQLTGQHKVELITLDSTLKTADLTVALGDKESPSSIKSPDGKKKKKERSELKLKILGKDKSHKKEAKAKSSPKRLKTLGASIEIPDQPENEKTHIIQSFESHTKLQGDQLAPSTTQIEMSIPKLELDMPEVAFIPKSPQKGEEKIKTGKESKEKQETKTGATFKLPKIDLSGITTEDIIQEKNANVEESTAKTEQFATAGTEVKEDPYEQLSKSSFTRTQLPKREEIEIPGMEDMSMRTKTKRQKEPKAGFMGHYEAETVQLSIDVESVKEAVSKLPGYKLPKVDTSGVPIPDEITVIDANAQRISVKTPTKVVDTKKHETHSTYIDVTASPEISKTTIKLPKITPADITLEELVTETKIDFKKTEKEHKTMTKQSDTEIKTEVYKREDIIIPGKESAHTEIKLATEGIMSTAKLSPKKSKHTIMADIKVPSIGIHLPKQKEIDNIEYIDSVDDPSARKDGGITGFGVNHDVAKQNTDTIIPVIRGELKDFSVPDADKGINIDGAEIKTFERDGKGIKFKMPNLDISMPKAKGSKIDFSLSKKDTDVILPDAKAEVTLQEVPQVDTTFGNIDVSEPKMKIQPLQTDVEIGSKMAITMPKIKGPEVDLSFSKKERDVPEVKAYVQIQEEANISVDTKQLQSEAEMEVQGSKFKMPELGITIPKAKGPAIDFSLSQKDVDLTQPETRAEVKLPDIELKEPSAEVEIKATEIEKGGKDAEGSRLKFKMPTIKLPKFAGADTYVSDDDSNKIKAIQLPEAKLESSKEGVIADIKTPNTDIEGPSIDVTTAAESKFKMPKFEISLPKVKGPETDFSLSKKDIDATLPEAKLEVNLPDVEPIEPGVKAEIKAPEIAVHQQDVERSPSKYKMPSFKLPKFGIGTPNISVKKTDMDKNAKIEGDDIEIPEEVLTVDIAAPSVDTESPLIDIKTTGTEQDEKGSKFKMPHLGFTMPKVKGPKFDLSLSKKDVDVALPDHKTDVTLPEVDLGKVNEAKMEIPETKAEVKLPEAPKIALEMEQLEPGVGSHGGKFKAPKFGIKMPKVKGPEFDLSLSKKDVDVTLPQTKLEVKLPDAPEVDVSLGKAEVLIPEAKAKVEKPELEIEPLQAEIKGQRSKFKLPGAQVKFPAASKSDIHLGKAEVLISETKVEVKKSEVEIKPLQTDVELKGKGSKLKMPKFGITMPKVKGPEIDLSFSKKDADVTLPEEKAEVELPEASQISMEIKSPECEAEVGGQGSKFKVPKFGISMPKVQGPEINVSLSKKPKQSKLPEVKTPVKPPVAPEIDVNLEKVDVSISDAKMELKKPEIKPFQSEGKNDRQGSTFQMPKFGISVPKVEGPEVDISLSKRDVDIILPEAKADVSLPDVELKEPSSKVDIMAPTIEAQLHSEKGSPSKFKMPAFKFPKFGVTTANVSISVPKVKRPEIDLSSSKKDVDVALPEVKVEGKLPDMELKGPSAEVDIKAPQIEAMTKDIKGSPSKLKTPSMTFNLPKFGVSTPSVTAEVPEMEKDIKLDGGDVKIPEEVLTVDIAAPSIDTEGPSINIRTTGTEHEGKGSKFKMPSLGFSVPEVKRPDIDLSLSKKEVDVTLPEVKAEGKLPDIDLEKPSAKVDIKAPGIDVKTSNVEGSPSKFKMPTFTFPKFGGTTPKVSAEVPDVDKDIKIDGEKLKLPKEEVTVDVTAPSIDTDGLSVDVKGKGSGLEGSGSKFKMPKFGISMPKVKGPEIDLSISKKDVDVTVPEVKAEVKLPDAELKEPSAEVDIKAPEIKVATKNKEGSPLKFKIPTFSLPKFGVSTPSVTAEVPEMEKDIKLDGGDVKIPEEVLTVDIAAPSIDTEGPSINIKTTGTEHEGKGSKFKMPSLGFSVPEVKRPDIDLSLSKKDVDVTLPEVKAEGKLPDIDLEKPSAKVDIKAPGIDVKTSNVEGSPSKFKMPTFTFPKFGGTTPKVSAEVPDVDKDIKIDGEKLKLPKEEVTVDVTAPSIDTDGLSVDVKGKGVELEGSGSKFKMPKFGISMPKVKGPEIDLSISKKDVDVTVPEVKAEVKLPDAELKEPSAEVDIKAPEIKVATKNKEGSPLKFKIPTFSLPKFGVSTPSVTAEVPEMEKDIKLDGGDVKIPEEVLTVDIAAPSIDTEGPSINIKTTGTEHEGKGSKFKMPSLGFTVPEVKRPDIDLSLSKKDVDVTLPEVKAEVKLPDAELKEPSAEVDIKAPELKVATKNKEGSPLKFKIPTFSLPKFGVSTPSVTAEVPEMEKDIKLDGGDVKIPEEVLTVDIAAPSIDTEGPSINIKTTGTEHEGKGSKFKMPSLGFTVPEVKRPDIDLSLSKKDVDVTLPEVKAEVKLPDVEVKKPSAEVEMTASGIDVQTSNTEGSPSKFKMPTLKLPKFGAASPRISVDVPDVDKDLKGDGVDLKLPQTKVEVNLPDVEIKEPVGAVSVSQAAMTESDAKSKKTRFSLPKFSFSKQSTKEPGAEVSLPGANVTLPEGNVKIEKKNIELKSPEVDVELDGQGSKFKMPKFGISMPKVKGPEIDLSISKKDVDVTVPEVKAEVKLPEVELKEPSAEVDIKAPEIKVATKNKEGSPSKFKMPIFSLPKFGVGTSSVTAEVPEIEKDVKLDGGDVKIPEEVLTVDSTAPSIDIEGSSINIKTTGTENEGKGSKFKMPSLGFSVPEVKQPDIDLSLSKKDAEVKLPDIKPDESTAKVEIKASGIDVQTSNVEGSPSKFKMPTFTFPKFGATTPKVSAEVPDVDKELKVDGTNLDLSKEGTKLEVTAPTIDTESLSVDVKVKGSKPEGSGSKFKMPKFGKSVPTVKGPESDPSMSKKDVDMTLPEVKADVKLPNVKVKETKDEISVPDAPSLEVEAQLKQRNWTFPKFSFSRTGGKATDVDVNLETPKVDVKLPEANVEICPTDVKVQESSGTISVEEQPAAELDANVKKPKFSLPRFSTSKTSVKEPGVSAEPLHVDSSLPEGNIVIKQPEIEIKAPKIDTEHDEQEGKFKFPKFGISLSKTKGPEEDLNESQKKVGITLPEVKVEVTHPETAGQNVDIKTDASKTAMTDTEMPKTETHSEDHGSPSKFKMPSFKMPKLSFTRPKPEDEYVPVETECKDDQLETEVEPKGETKSPKTTLTSFGEILKNIDVEFDVSSTDKEEKTLDTMKDVKEKEEPSGKQVESKKKETEQDTTKSPERTGWFKFPRFGLSSPSEPVKTTEKEEQKDVKSPVGETVDDEGLERCKETPLLQPQGLS